MSLLLGRAGRCVVATVTLAVFFLAAPAEAAGAQEGQGGFFELVARAVSSLDGWLEATLTDAMASTGGGVDHEGAYIDPNGGGRTGSCENPAGCDSTPPTSSSTQTGS